MNDIIELTDGRGEEFLGSGNIVLAANQEEAEFMQGTDQNNLEGVVEENSSENNSSDSEVYDTAGLDILFEVEDNRDRTSKHFRLSDGTIMAADYGMDAPLEASADADVSLMQADDTVSMEAMNSSDMEEAGPVPITFIKGEILNASEAAQVLHVEENCFEPVSSFGTYGLW